MIDQQAFVHLPKRDPEGFMLSACSDIKSKCWNFNSAVDWRHPYPRVRIPSRSVPAHRLAYEMFVGPIPEGMSILHGCDNKRCVNPSHLRAGTQRENMADMKARFGPRKWTQGASHYNAKFTEIQVREIRRAHAAGASISSLAIITGSTFRTISIIVRRLAWRSLP